MRFLAPLILIGAILASQVVLAVPLSSFEDVRNAEMDEALSLLVERGAVESRKKFFPSRMVNRAEFIKMAIRAAFPNHEPDFPESPCFQDVPVAAWYAWWICSRVLEGELQGYPVPGSGHRIFKPAQHVTYAEALKIALMVFDWGGCPNPGDDPWYQSCFTLANVNNVGLDLDPSWTINRGGAAMLLAQFIKHEGGGMSSSPSSLSSSRSSLPSSSSSSSLSSSTGTFDPLSDTSIRSRILLLGETGPVIGSVSIFMNEEPMDVSSISVNLTAIVPTVQSLLIYDENKRYLGRANLDPSASTNRKYKLTLSSGTLTLEYRKPFKVYARPSLLHKELGGQSNQTVRVSEFVIEGNGIWSSAKYAKASTEIFQPFLTARSLIASVRNALEANAALVLGSNQRIGSFTFEGRRTDPSAHIDVTELSFHVSATGGASITNVRLGADDTTDRHTCTVASTTITCSSIPANFGALENGPRTLTLYADVSTTDAQHASLQIILNEPGSATTAGAVTWSDGTTTFTWVPVEGPVANGTRYSY